MKKRFFALAIATLALSACGLKSPETTTTAAKADNAETTAAKADAGSAEVTLVYAEVNPLDTIVGQTGTAFKERWKSFQEGKSILMFRQAEYSVRRMMYLTECLEVQVL